MVAIVDSCVLYNWNLLKVSTLNIFTKKKRKDEYDSLHFFCQSYLMKLKLEEKMKEHNQI